MSISRQIKLTDSGTQPGTEALQLCGGQHLGNFRIKIETVEAQFTEMHSTDKEVIAIKSII